MVALSYGMILKHTRAKDKAKAREEDGEQLIFTATCKEYHEHIKITNRAGAMHSAAKLL